MENINEIKQEFTVGTSTGAVPVQNSTINTVLHGGDGFQPNIVVIGDVEVGDFFSGLIYVRSSYTKRNNSDKTKYDLTLLAVDGAGEIFTLRLFQLNEKVEIVNRVINVENGQKVIAYDKIFYNAKTFTYNRTEQVSTSRFLKEIESIDKYKAEFNEQIQVLASNPVHNQLFTRLCTELDLVGKLYVSPYPHKYGGRIGHFLKVVVDTIKIYENLGSVEKERSPQEKSWFLILLLVTLAQTINREHRKFHESTTNELDKLSLIIEPYMIQIIYSAGLTNDEIAILTEAIVAYNEFSRTGEITYGYPDRMEMFNCLKLVNSKLFIDNQRN